MKERVRPPRELESVLDRLKDDNVVETKQKGMMFAAAIGFAFRASEIDSVEIEQHGEGIKMEYFRTPQDDGFIDALAVTWAQDLKVLAMEHQETRIELFEKCAALGLQELKKWCYDNRPNDPLVGVLELLDEVASFDTDRLPGIESVSERVGEYL